MSAMFGGEALTKDAVGYLAEAGDGSQVGFE
jgi:hypothetical protein